MSNQQGEGEYVYRPPTLESIPPIALNPSSHETLPLIIRGMQTTGFHIWGFLIYRCTYSDDAAWERYIEQMKRTTMKKLERDGRDLLLPQYLKWTIIEDKEALENASKADVRARFSDWASQRSVERDGPGADHSDAECLTRFNYCIYVDQECLNTLRQYEDWINAGSKGSSHYLVCVIIDEDCDPEGEGDDGYRPSRDVQGTF